MTKRWRIQPFDEGLCAALQQSAGLPAVVAQLLVARGIHDPETAQRFLTPKLAGLRDPNELPGVPRAVARILSAIDEATPIVVFGDYDADGVTGAAILFNCLQLLGAKVSTYVPNRMEEGYGLADDSIRKIASGGAKLIVTVDCGITSVAECETARELGVELVITDHHEFAASLPNAAAIVHPRLPGTNYPFGGLSGSGVAFKLAWALCVAATKQAAERSANVEEAIAVATVQKVSDRMRTFLLSAVGLAAIGTVADMVPLVDENRHLVHDGLERIAKNAGPGLAALLKITELNKKSRLSSEDIGFAIAPRINAAGRLGQAALALELLTTESPTRATALAEYIHELNNSRTSLERSVYLAANKQAQEEFDTENDPALVLAGRGWHQGVIGIVAGRLAEKYHKPVILISLDQADLKPGVGSGRAGMPGFNLHEALAHCSECLMSHGGHAAAAGLRIEANQVDAFRTALLEYAAGEVAEATQAELRIDAEAPFSMLTCEIVKQIEQLAPFGQGNQRPLLCATSVTLCEPPKRMGGNGRHASFIFSQHNIKLRAVAFGNGDWVDELSQMTGALSVAFRPVINEFAGRSNVELHLADWRKE